MFIAEHIRHTPIDYASFEDFAAAVDDLEVPLREVGARLFASVEAQFATEGAAHGTPWKELTEPYREWKEGHVPGLPKLVGIVRQGLGRSAEYRASGETRKRMLDPAYMAVGRHELVYRPDTEVGYHHQTGTQHMPARPPVVILEPLVDEWKMVFVGWLDGLIGGMN